MAVVALNACVPSFAASRRESPPSPCADDVRLEETSDVLEEGHGASAGVDDVDVDICARGDGVKEGKSHSYA